MPTSPEDPAAADNRAAWKVLATWTKPFMCCFSDGDPVTKGGAKPFLEHVPGAEGQAHTTIANAHHFSQEDASPQLAQLVIDAIGHPCG